MVENVGSLLGDAFSQAAQIRQRRERRDERDFMKKQLLYAFAAPLVSSAGQGLVNFAGDLVLGSNAKGFFDREEGVSLRNRLNSMSNEFDKFDTMHNTYLKAGGGDVKNGMRATLLEAKKRNMQQYEGDPIYEATKGLAYTLSNEEEQNLDMNYNEFMSAYEELQRAKDLTGEELARRFADTKIGKGRARRIVARVASALNPNVEYERDVVLPAVDRMITGGDRSLRETEFYKAAMSSDYFRDAFKKKLVEASDIGIYTSADDVLGNVVESMSRDPEITDNGGFRDLLNTNLRRRIENAKESSSIQNEARENVFMQRLVNQLEREGKTINRSNLSEAAVQAIGLVDDTEQFVNNWMSRDENSEIVSAFRDETARRIYRLGSYEEAKESSKAKIDESISKKFEEMVKIFNNEVSLVLTDVSQSGQFNFDDSNISPRSIQGLASRYLTTALDPKGEHLAMKSYNFEDASLVTKTFNLFNSQTRHTGTFKNTDKLTDMIREHLITKDVSDSDARTATEQGLSNNMRSRSGDLDEARTLSRVEAELSLISRDTQLTPEERNNKMRELINKMNEGTGNAMNADLLNLYNQYSFDMPIRGML